MPLLQDRDNLKRKVDADRGVLTPGRQSVLGGPIPITANVTAFHQLSTGGAAGGTISDLVNGMIMPCDVTFSKLHLKLNVAPGSNNSATGTLAIDGVASALTAPVSGASAVAATDSTHSVVAAEGSLVKLQMATTPSITSTNAAFGILATI